MTTRTLGIIAGVACFSCLFVGCMAPSGRATLRAAGAEWRIIFDREACAVRGVELNGKSLTSRVLDARARRTQFTRWESPPVAYDPFAHLPVHHGRSDGAENPLLAGPGETASFRQTLRRKGTVCFEYETATTTGGTLVVRECFSGTSWQGVPALRYWTEFAAQEEVNWVRPNWLRFADPATGGIANAVSILPAHHRFHTPSYVVWQETGAATGLEASGPFNNASGIGNVSFPNSNLALTVVPEEPWNLVMSLAMRDNRPGRAAMERHDDKGASGGRYMESVPGSVARFTFTAPQAGTYRLWARCRWTNVGKPGEGNSFLQSVAGSKPAVLGNTNTPDWHWEKGATYQLEAGEHLLEIACREPKSHLDRVALAPDAAGDGPPENAWSMEAEDTEDPTAEAAKIPEVGIFPSLLANHAGTWQTPPFLLLADTGDPWDGYYNGYHYLNERLREEFGIHRTPFEPTLDIRHQAFQDFPPGSKGFTFRSIADQMVPRCLETGIRWISLDCIETYDTTATWSMGIAYQQLDYQLRPELGGDEGMRYLCERAHAAGLKVIQRMYTSISPKSKIAHEHPEWFVPRRDGGALATFGDWVWDLANPDVRAYLMERVRHKRSLGIEGIETTPPPDLMAWHYGRNDACQSEGFWRFIAEIQELGMIAITECPKPAIGSGGCFLQAGVPGGGLHPYEGLTARTLEATVLLGQTVLYRAGDLPSTSPVSSALVNANRRYNAILDALGPFETRLIHTTREREPDYGKEFQRATHPYAVGLAVHCSPQGKALVAGEAVRELVPTDGFTRLRILAADGSECSVRSVSPSHSLPLSLAPGEVAIFTRD